ncbi:hypothetical protein GPY51_10900 [Photorhabdus laumondii subsp. laumondii]|uniref:Phage protein n=2 Tax=Photorhabdus TaxID=29487 RepID=A0ABX0AYV5_9GAMM|nr:MULTISPECIES: hypothetical protein [Photorhabdus]MCC8376418.1 hypothetical protein [Photorhabdus bodei]MCC8384617.1 hypothetical protein [Photorhabdus laumondii]MCC8413337.1 hypothetical protein [Photorhabdus laumondii]MCC8421969.1 hypothetical protein [Photorhabdus thracensis]MCC8463863.1 hypothetical protein [Photorhabdus bodei]
MKKSFYVVAGKYVEYEGEQTEDIKFAHSFNTMEEAEKCVIENELTVCQICRIEVYFN